MKMGRNDRELEIDAANQEQLIKIEEKPCEG